MSTITDKNKRISAYVDVLEFEKFTRINALYGISTNKMLNLLIKDYNDKNKKALEFFNENGFSNKVI